MTLFRNEERERIFLNEVKRLECSAPLRASPDFGCYYDASNELKAERAALQKQVLAHFNEFSQKFSLLPQVENKDVNLSVAWWGKWPSVYHGAAQNGFWNLPQHLKLDPGYFGEGFYLTRYPRYSDYYINGFSLSKRKIENGNILMCYAALGRPYPVTQDPFSPPDNTKGPPAQMSPCGRACGAECGFSSSDGIDSHDSHYVTVKLHPKAGQYFPCPLRQEPDFDEIVVFNTNRILPAAYVTFHRRCHFLDSVHISVSGFDSLMFRRKTILWLDDHPDSPENIRIRNGIPGHVHSKPIAGLSDGRLSLVSDNTNIPLEEQVDVTLFTSVDAIENFLNDPKQHKFIKYPCSMFRIVSNRRLFVGQNGLFARMSANPYWRSAFPAILVFHGSCDDGLDLVQSRPNMKITRQSEECVSFVSFQTAEVSFSFEEASIADRKVITHFDLVEGFDKEPFCHFSFVVVQKLLSFTCQDFDLFLPRTLMFRRFPHF
jgi:hypothetical protein